MRGNLDDEKMEHLKEEGNKRKKSVRASMLMKKKS